MAGRTPDPTPLLARIPAGPVHDSIRLLWDRINALTAGSGGVGPPGPAGPAGPAGAAGAPGTPGSDATVQGTLVAGGAAGNFTVAGIAVTDLLVLILYYAGAGVAVTDVLDLTSEFTITGANTINNSGGTDTTGGKLVVLWSAP